MKDSSRSGNRRIPSSIVLFAMLFIVSLSSFAATKSIIVDDIKYSLDLSSGEASVARQSTDLQKQNLVIPDVVTYDGVDYPVTSIASKAFDSCIGVTGSLKIAVGVTSIGDYAFNGCDGLTGDLIIPDGVVSIGKYAFAGCHEVKGLLKIGNAVETIGKWAFFGCGFTGSLTIPNSVETIGAYAFLGGSFDGNLVIGNGVRTIEDSAFSGCKFMGSLTLGKSIKKIGECAFTSCHTLSGPIVLPNSVDSIYACAFEYCEMLTGDLVIPNSVKYIGSGAFVSCSGLMGTLTLPNALDSIGQYAFDGCSFTGNLKIPDSVVFIGESAFNGCPFLSSVELGAGVEKIEHRAFGNNDLKYIVSSASIPPAITGKGEGPWRAFSDNVYKGVLVVPTESMEAYASAYEWKEFDWVRPVGWVMPEEISLSSTEVDLDFNATLHLTATITPVEAADETVIWSSSDNSVATVDSDGNVTAVGLGYAEITAATINGLSATCSVSVSQYDPFIYEYDIVAKTASVKGLKADVTEVIDPVIPSTTFYYGESYRVTSIYYAAFMRNTALKGTLTLPNSLETIGGLAFCYCSELTGSLIIPNSVKVIENSAFSDCTGLNGQLQLGDSLEELWAHAFYGCSGLTGSLIIPNSVKKIQGYAFSHCSGFNGKLQLSESLDTLFVQSFFKCSGLTGPLVIPESVTAIDDWVFKDCSGFEGELRISENVKSIGQSAFAGCTGLYGSLTLPNSISNIEWGTFMDCSGLSGELIIPESVVAIGDFAFKGTEFKSIVSKAVIPPGSYNAFSEKNYKRPLYVPDESLESYRQADEWKKFFHSKPIGCVDAESVVLNMSDAQMRVGEQLTLIATVMPEDTYDKSIEWISSNEGVATVNNGVVTAIAEGDVVITAITDNELMATCNVSVSTSVAYGDVNGDGVINVADVTLVANYIAGIEIENFNVEAADINGDGDITVTDAIMIARLILQADMPETVGLYTAPVRTSASERLEVNRHAEKLYLSLSSSGFTAFQADIELPKGVSLKRAALSCNYQDSHILMTADKGDNVVRLVVFSLSNSMIGQEESVVELTLSDSLASVVGGRNVVASYVDGEISTLILNDRSEMSDLDYTTMSQGLEVTAVDGGVVVTGAAGQTINCYALDGRMIVSRKVETDCELLSLSAGIYVVKVADKSTKVVIK